MKKYYIAILIMFLYLHPAYAGMFDVQVYQIVSGDSENIVENGTGAKIRAYYDDLYIYVQKEDTSVRFGGQGGTDVGIFSVGIGARFRIKPNFYISFDGGWYEPKSDNQNQIFPETTLSEGLYYYLNNYLGASRLWDYYTLQYQGSMGATVNIDYSYAIAAKWNLGLSAGYRYLNLNEKIKGKDFGYTDGWWEIKQPRSFSGGLISFSITRKFL